MSSLAKAPRTSLLSLLSFKRISAVYIFIALFVLFSLWVPKSFLSAGVWRSMLNGQALYALVAISLVLTLAAGSFDLAIGSQAGFGGILVAALLVKAGLPIPLAVLATLVCGGLIGLTAGLLIVKAHIDSFIATLGMSSVLLALTAWVSGSQQILNLGEEFSKLAVTPFLGVTTAFWIMIAVAFIAWYVLERTSIGRHIYATGGNPEAARLAGVNTNAVIVGTLVAGGIIAALAGLLLTSQVGTGDPTVGSGFLLPAFAAAFLGSTQFHSGRYNVWGAVLSIYVLATGVKGLQLTGAPVWIPDLFNGVALLLAVGLAARQYRQRRRKIAKTKLLDAGGGSGAAVAEGAGTASAAPASAAAAAPSVVSEVRAG